MNRRFLAIGVAAIVWLGWASTGRSENYCHHPLLPIVVGAQWFYEGEWTEEEQGYGVTVQTVLTRGTTTNAILNLALDILGAAPLPVPLYCTAAEGIRLVELKGFAVPLPGGSLLSLQFKETAGVILPPMETITSGASWPFVIDFTGVLTTKNEKNFNISLRMEVMSHFAGTTQIEVPAGTFPNAYKIEQDVLMTLSFGERMSKPLTFEGRRTWYLVPDVGMVAADFRRAHTELMSFSIPATVE